MNDDHKIMIKFWQKSFETSTNNFGHEEVLGIVYILTGLKAIYALSTIQPWCLRTLHWYNV